MSSNRRHGAAKRMTGGSAGMMNVRGTGAPGPNGGGGGAPPTTPNSGGIYDLDATFDNIADDSVAIEPRLDNLRALNKNKASFGDMLRAADADAANHAARMRKFHQERNQGGRGGQRGHQSASSAGGGRAVHQGDGRREASTWRERVDKKRRCMQ